MKDISLYGHLTIDTIVDGVKERKTLGSMANVCGLQSNDFVLSESLLYS